jgi:hypothetical protein
MDMMSGKLALDHVSLRRGCGERSGGKSLQFSWAIKKMEERKGRCSGKEKTFRISRNREYIGPSHVVIVWSKGMPVGKWDFTNRSRRR